MSARPAAWLRTPATLAPSAVLVTATDVMRRAKELAALATGIDANVHQCAAQVPDAEYAAWTVEYAKDAAILDPMIDPLLGIIPNPWAAWSAMDALEPALLQWRAKANGYCGINVPIPAPTPDPISPSDLGGLDTFTKAIVAGVVALGLIIAWKV